MFTKDYIRDDLFIWLDVCIHQQTIFRDGYLFCFSIVSFPVRTAYFDMDHVKDESLMHKHYVWTL